MADIGDIVRTAVSYSSAGASEQLNVFWHIIEDMGIGNPTLLSEIADWIENDWGLIWGDIASSESTLVSISVDIMNPDGTVKINVGIELIGLDGNGASTVTPAANAGYVLAQTINPKARGSKYIPGIDEGAVDAGVFTLASVVDLLLLAGLFVTPINTAVGATLRAGILSRVSQTFLEFLVDASTTDVVAYQRRRKPNVGS